MVEKPQAPILDHTDSQSSCTPSPSDDVPDDSTNQPSFHSQPLYSSPQDYRHHCYTSVIVAPPITNGQPLVRQLVVTMVGFGPYPQQMICPKCNSTIVTQTIPNPGLLTWILSGTLLLIGCFMGCCLIPCCISECQDVDHICPHCKSLLGTYRRM
ncbi:hypothetical protein B4U79_01459 [Dinothrombium tinctorium]|uniref:LITAF domain-containing protein n=1 Tax=Dinothrombium tinctorium TaxID=1965070 RepID=A0A3S3PIM1_9ACAR|nr:hypothetical protein B4U79_15478 [Dinothrombium tinctorium]RWS13685.1 hypothetical protein B4U79_01459 [Dinothrombium tinctorium]